MISAFCLLLISTLTVGCDLNTPTSPNSPAQLTGQTTNQQFTFSGTIGVLAVSGTVIADDNSTVTITAIVRDQSGNPIQNLTTVTFSTDLGGFVTGVDNTGGAITSSVTSAVTFNGQAQVSFVSVGRDTGTATVRANIGNTSASTQLKLEPAPIEGTIALLFTGGGVTLSGVASSASPLDAPISLEALDLEGNPIVGANVSFRILQDTTGDNSSNPYAEFVASRHTTTGAAGDAANILRSFGPGVVVVVAELYDPNSGNLVGTSNRIIMTTSRSYLISLQFNGGGTTVNMAAPYTANFTATVTDADLAPQQGLTVRFSITADSTTAGASLSNSLQVTSAAGGATSSVTVPDDAAGAGSSVTIVAEVVDSTGAVLSTSNVIVAVGS
jgi:hypothetical protein